MLISQTFLVQISAMSGKILIQLKLTMQGGNWLRRDQNK